MIRSWCSLMKAIGIVTGRREVADIEIHADVLTERHDLREAFGRGELFGIVDGIVPVARPQHLVLDPRTGATRFAMVTVELEEIALTPRACAMRNE